MSPPVRRQRGGNQRRDPARRCRPVAEWPQTHRHAWTMAVRQGDRLNPGGPASQWAPRSKLKTEKGYGRFLTWLDLRGELDPESPPGTGVTPARIATFIDDLLGQGNTTYTALGRIQELYDALRSMAPTSSWRWFHDFAAQLRDEVVTSKKKLEQIQHVDELLEVVRIPIQSGQ